MIGVFAALTDYFARARRREVRDEHDALFGITAFRHYLPDLVYGANDGIITTFAVLSGVVGAALSARTAVILGTANLLADAVSMGASNYLAIRSQNAVDQGAVDSEPYPLRHGVATALSFIVAGAVPLLPWVLVAPRFRFVTAVSATLAVLFVAGALRAAVTRLAWWRAGLEMLTIGSIAAVVAYLVGLFLSGVV